jgi:Lipid A 3-O-deacylase (PagL)
MRRKLIPVLLLCSYALLAQTTSPEKNWPGIPAFNKSGIALINQKSFLGVFGAAASSFLITQLALKNKAADLDFYQARVGVIGVYDGTVFLQNVGISKQIVPWFGVAIEADVQEWRYNRAQQSGFGGGFNFYYKWNIFGKKRLSPYLEYGTGLFFGAKRFPHDGTHFTFNLSSQLGAEYRLKNQDRVRVSYGHLHHSNNNTLSPNPGEDGNGFHMAYVRFWK